MSTSARTAIDLNADCGESYGPWRMGHDAELMPWLSSVNLACGGHAGDPVTMLGSVRLALQSKLAIGAHPGYPDLLGFGRRSLALSEHELYAWCLAQIGSLQAIVRAEGGPDQGQLRHVKAHGALYHDLETKPELARAFLAAVAGVDRRLHVVGVPGGALASASQVHGLRFVGEGFVERGYGPDARLLPRSHPGAVLHEPSAIIAQAQALVCRGGVHGSDGSWLDVPVETLCLHGDRADAAKLAQMLHQHFTALDVAVRAVAST